MNPDPVALDSPRLADAGLSADTSSTLLLEFSLWGQDGQWIAKTSWTCQREGRC